MTDLDEGAPGVGGSGVPGAGSQSAGGDWAGIGGGPMIAVITGGTEAMGEPGGGGDRGAGGSSATGAAGGSGGESGGRSSTGGTPSAMGGLPVFAGSGGATGGIETGGVAGFGATGGLLTMTGGAPAGSGGGTGGGEARRPPVELYGPDDNPLGRSHEDWLTKFWQWSFSMPKSKHPREGGACSEGQDPRGPHWFLTTGQNGYPQERSCEIPAWRTVVILLNAVVLFPRPDCEACQTSTMEEWFDNADQFSAAPTEQVAANVTFLEVDGWAYDVDEHYFLVQQDFFFAEVDPLEPEFQCSGPIGENTCGWEEGTARPFRSSGYIVVLKGLSPGAHTLRYGSDSPPGSGPQWHTDVTYHIEVK